MITLHDKINLAQARFFFSPNKNMLEITTLQGKRKSNVLDFLLAQTQAHNHYRVKNLANARFMSTTNTSTLKQQHCKVEEI